MGSNIRLKAADGFELDAYKAEPAGRPRGGIVVIQEIFGVNDHVRKVADGYAADGYLVIAPALFDRSERGVQLGYTPDDIARGREYRAAVGLDDPLKDIAAAIEAAGAAGKVGAVGYCWGGLMAWLTATRLSPDASVVYYGGSIANHKEETPNCPVMMHFGERDKGIPLSDVDQVKAAHLGLPIHIYPAGHGFNCEQRADYDATCARQARERTIEFFRRHVG